MRALGNFLWHIPFLGFVSALIAFFVGALFYVTFIGLPIAKGLFELGNFLLAPFTRSTISEKHELLKNQKIQSSIHDFFKVIAFILYFPFGIANTILIICRIPALFLSIIGIPVALVLIKSLPTIFNPIGKICVPKAVADEIKRRSDQKIADQYLKHTEN